MVLTRSNEPPGRPPGAVRRRDPRLVALDWYMIAALLLTAFLIGLVAGGFSHRSRAPGDLAFAQIPSIAAEK
jgi:hypothetical protein